MCGSEGADLLVNGGFERAQKLFSDAGNKARERKVVYLRK